MVEGLEQACRFWQGMHAVQVLYGRTGRTFYKVVETGNEYESTTDQPSGQVAEVCVDGVFRAG